MCSGSRIWIHGLESQDLALWIWVPGFGSQDLDLWVFAAGGIFSSAREFFRS